MASNPIYIYDVASQFITPLAVVWDEKFVAPILDVVLAGCTDRAYVTTVRLHGSDTDPLKAPPKTKAFSAKRFLRR